ncbi:hypothetical protein [Fundidesulfovibrio putealis]|uniref:hypothetical protein n=1 Tax=Fundidesulfovibrio putealis TaxID=270496 RepID=UPI0004177821|nr:hypothetical protein [Fundidesulfovibrio putealis]
MKVGNKNSNSQSASLSFEGGINVSQPSTTIADNELQSCVNLFYSNHEKYLTTRMGIKIVDVPALTHPIDKLYEYVKNETEKYLIAVSNGELLYLKSTIIDDVETLSWQKITDLTNSTIIPSLITYSNELIIADRGTCLRSWNGTTVSDITTSPSYVTILEEINGRLVCNSEASGELDAVYFSGPFNKANWDTNNGAVGVRAGYGNGRKVTGIGIVSDYVVAFKEDGKAYRISASDFSVYPIFSNNRCTSQTSIEPVGNDLVFGSDTGINSIATVQEHGDVKFNLLGTKVSPLLNGKLIKEAVWSNFYGILFMIVEGMDNVLIYHPHLNTFTIFDYGIRISSICNGKDLTYFSDSNGKLYRSTNLSRDELQLNTFTEIRSKLVTKCFTFPKEILLKETRLYLEQIDYTKGKVLVLDRTNRIERVLYNWEPNYAGFLHDANGYLHDANIYIYGDAFSYVDIKNSYRDQAMSIIIDIELGRVKIKNIDLNFAVVNG